tara:strand:+ start:9 stop:146 length:138 start_codon:yes stop_codon:yes gene_type:complete
MVFTNPGFVKSKPIAVTDDFEISLHAQERVFAKRMVRREKGAEGK